MVLTAASRNLNFKHNDKKLSNTDFRENDDKLNKKIKLQFFGGPKF